MATTPTAAPAWTRAVALRADPGLAERLGEAIASGDRAVDVWVTDLIDPRPALQRLLHPIPVSPEKAERLREGRRAHERIQRGLARPAEREVPVGRDGIVGRIDLLLDRPVEIKSTNRMPDPEHLDTERPLPIEQLAAYCALLDRTEGRLLFVRSGGGEGPLETLAFECRFRDVEGMRARLREARDRYRRALAARSPEGLPRCLWFGRGCEYQSAGVCGCGGEEPTEPIPLREQLIEVRIDAAVNAAISAVGRAPAAPRPVPARFQELVYPLYAYFERTAAPRVRSPEGAVRAWSGSTLYRELRGSLESVQRARLRSDFPAGAEWEEGVELFQGDPVLVKTSGVATPPDAAEVVARHPLYVLELGLRCAALGRAEGWLVIGYDRLPDPRSKVRVHRATFPATSEWSGWLAERTDQLREAIRCGSPRGLEPCPSYRCPGCDYRGECRDGAVSREPPDLQR